MVVSGEKAVSVDDSELYDHLKLIDYERLQGLFGAVTYDQFTSSHRGWIEDYLGNGAKSRQSEWTDSVAVGSKLFAEKFKTLLGVKAMGRSIINGGERYHLREAAAPYMPFFEVRTRAI